MTKWFWKANPSASEKNSSKLSYEFSAVKSWIDTHFPSSDVVCERISHADLVVERVLETSIIDFPSDPRPTQLLSDRKIAGNRFNDALKINLKRLEFFPGDKFAFFTSLRLLLLMNRLPEAKRLFDNAEPEVAKFALEEESARKLLIALIDGGGFDDEKLDFTNVFFAPGFVKNISSINEISRLFSDRYHFECLERAKAYVESNGATLVYVSVDNLFDVKNKSQTEEFLLSSELWSEPGKRLTWLKALPKHVVEHYGGFSEYSDEFIDQIFGGPNHILQATRVALHDFKAEFVNVVNNKRVTTKVPSNTNRRVLVLGGSDVYGFGADDGRTVPSYLQHKLNSHKQESFKVENHGLRGNPLPVCLANLFQTKVQPNDIVVLFGYPKLVDKPAFLADIVSHHISFSRPHDFGEIFLDHAHVGPKGNEVIADKLFDIVSSQIARNGQKSSHEIAPLPCIDFIKYLIYLHSATMAESTELKEYVSYIRERALQQKGVCGSVAVNCNPMTKGHLHLLEYAASKVDQLYVFVIEEDLSFFAFKHRLAMVEQGLAHVANVTVLPGGRYICTQLTYPEYFSKEDLGEVKADASMEAWFFCEYIAKAMNISIIFLGEEPTCDVTRQYNAKMSEILPQYGISVDIIPRIGSSDGQPISASSVRRLLKAGQFDEIFKIVPETTYDILRAHYWSGE